MNDYDDLPPADPAVRVYATYPAVPWACPESVSVDVPTGNGANVPGAIYAAVDALARVPSYAQLARDEVVRASEARR